MTPVETAFEACYARVYPTFKRYAWGELGEAEAALEVTVSTLESLWQRVFNGPPNPFVQPDRIAFRMLKMRIDHTREARADVPGATVATWAARAKRWLVADDAEPALLERVVQEALDAMRPRCREVFLLRREASLSFKDIAFLTSTDVKSVSALMHRAQFVLRDRVEQAGFGADARRFAAESGRWKILEFSRQPDLYESQEAIIERSGNPDSAIISDFIAGELPDHEAAKVSERLEHDADFRAIAEPLLIAWSAPPRSTPVSEDELRSSWARLRERAGLGVYAGQGHAS